MCSLALAFIVPRTISDLRNITRVADAHHETPPAHVPQRDRYWLHIFLFLATLASTILAGGQWSGRTLLYALEGTGAFISDGLLFAVSLLLFLTVHEFGHYFAARRHGVDVTLPFFIPLPFIGIGTLGAVIRIRQQVPDLRSLFDIGVAGPIAGFVIAFALLIGSLVFLPPPEYLLDMDGHDEMKAVIVETGAFPAEMPVSEADENTVAIIVGQTLLYRAVTSFFDDVPPMYEMYHYPVLFAAWLALFFTALNLLPVGQLDGGHVLYSLVGARWHRLLARGFVFLLLVSGGVGLLLEPGPGVTELRDWLGPYNWLALTVVYYFYLRKVFSGNHVVIAPSLLFVVAVTLALVLVPSVGSTIGHSGWLIWCLLIVFLIKVDHPPVLYTAPLSPGRRLLGIAAMIIFILCFSIRPFTVL